MFPLIIHKGSWVGAGACVYLLVASLGLWNGKAWAPSLWYVVAVGFFIFGGLYVMGALAYSTHPVPKGGSAEYRAGRMFGQLLQILTPIAAFGTGMMLFRELNPRRRTRR